MIISHTEAKAKLDKLAHDPATLLFALSPEGFLLIKKEKNFEISDFCLVLNGQYCRRDGLDIESDITLNPQGTFLCGFSKGKFIAPTSSDGYEYASGKKPLSQDYSMLLWMRFSQRIILLVADGTFASKACMITLADTPSNELFVTAVFKQLTSHRFPELSKKLFTEEEVLENG